MKKKWLSPEEYAKTRKKAVCAFNNYDEVTQDMVNGFWSKERYVEGLVKGEDVREEWRAVYEVAKKNVAMLDYAMSPSYTVYFDKEANLTIHINHGCSWSAQNHLSHYAGRCGKFKLQTAAWSAIDEKEWELLYDGQKRKET